MRILALWALIGWLAVPAAQAAAEVLVVVDKGAQRMTVSVDGSVLHVWRVSTGNVRRGYRTPSGTFHPERLERSWYSREYDNAPMPHAIFFHSGYAIHGTTETRNIGHAVSHGCVRLLPSDATTLFNLVKDRRADTRIVVSESDAGVFDPKIGSDPVRSFFRSLDSGSQH